MEDFIKQRLSEQKTFLLFKKIPIHLLQPLPSHINVQEVIDIVENKLPSIFFTHTNIESIYIGNFDHLSDRSIQASYEGGTIYLSNHENNPKVDALQLAKDITHEVAHAVHEVAGLGIFGDGSLESEFIGKRRALGNLLSMEDYEIEHYDFYNVEYDERFDEFLFKEVGYDQLSMLTVGLFDSPYSATSIFEYFANGFEDYFFGDIAYMKNISEDLFTKVESCETYLKEL